MKFERLELTRFGHFDKLALSFPAGSGFVIVKGANEAGKSTLLEAIRNLLFGIPKQTELGFKFGYPAMQLSAVLRDAAGRTIELVRRKKDKAALTGTRRSGATEEPVGEDELRGYLGGVRPEFFASVFGFSLADLQQGASTLLEASAGELLAGSALGGGGTRVRTLLNELAEECDALYVSGGRKRLVNERLTEIRALETTVREKGVDRDRYKELAGALDTKKAELARLQSELALVEQRKAHVETLKLAFPELHARVELERQRAALGDVLPLEESDAEKALELLATVKKLGDDVTAAEKALARLETSVRGHAVDPALVSHEEAIGSLAKRLELAQVKRGEIDDLEATIARGRARLLDSVEDQLPGADPAALSSRRLPKAARDELRSLGARWRKLEGSLDTARELVKRLESERDEARGAIGAPEKPEEGAERTLLDAELPAAKETHRKREERKGELAALRSQIDSRARRLRPAPPGDAPWEALPLPAREAVELLAREAASHESAKVQLAEEVRGREAKVGKARAERAALLAATRIPTAEELQAARAHRELGWKLVRQAWDSNSPTVDGARTFDPERPLAAAYERAVQDADHLADRLRDQANRWAQVVEIDVRIASEETDLAEARRRLGEAEATRRQWNTRWEALWKELGVAPAPVEAVAWLIDADWLREQAEKARVAEVEIASIEKEVQAYEARLRHYLDDAESPIAALFSALERRIREAHQIEAGRAAAEKTVARAVKELERESAKLAELVRSRGELAGTLASLLPKLGLEPDLAPEVAEGRVAEIEKLVAAARELDEQVRVCEAARKLVTDFEAEVARLLPKLNVQAGDRTPDQLVAWLAKELGKSVAAANARAQDELHVREKAEELAGSREALASATQEVERLRERARIPASADFGALAKRALERLELDGRINDKETRLAEMLGTGEARAKAERELAAARPEELSAEVTRLVREVQDEKDKVTGCATEVGALEQKLVQLGGDDAAQAQAQLEEVRAELEEQAQRYLRLHLARRLLGRVVERFSSESEPALLRRASELIGDITGGRYSKVVLPAGAKQLALETPAGDQLPPERLSTGTREQLFLALRLAYVLEYCSGAEPLPVILDDVLVNFDDERAIATLGALERVSRGAQAILLTCHDHLVALARKRVPDVLVHELTA